jgi:cell fate regulator YaaT (PSP1 superfamily)
MSHLVEIAFKGNRKEFFLWDGDDPPRVRTTVIVEGDRGEDLGEVHAIGELAAKRWAGVAHGEAMLGAGAPPARRALRLADPDEVRRAEELAALNEDARRRSMERVRAHTLVMKISDAEWQWDRRKLTLYFTAEKRVDFRALVRDLAALFRTRIELKQIGVRDEAKRLDGVGRCGRQYCSAAWLPELRPVNLSVAKDQRLSLNPTQISGACGRLMCSLRYEHDFYVQQRKRFPKEGKILTTAKGEEKVVANDIFRERVTLRAFDGEVRVVPLVELREEMEGLGGPFTTVSDETDVHEIAELTDAVMNAESTPRPSRSDPRESRDVREARSRDGGERRENDRRGEQRRASERRDLPLPADDPRAQPAAPIPMPAASAAGAGLVETDAPDAPMGAALDPSTPAGPQTTDVDATATAEGYTPSPTGEDPAAAGIAPGESVDGGEPRPRRRRGRRGGRRNRANRQATDTAGDGGEASNADDGDEGEDGEDAASASPGGSDAGESGESHEH